MRFTLSHALLASLLFSSPWTTAYPQGRHLVQRDLDPTTDLEVSVAENDYGEETKHRTPFNALEQRGLPRFGEKPDVPHTNKPISLDNGPSRPGSGNSPGSAPGAAPKPGFAGNSESARTKGEGLNSDLQNAILRNTPEAPRKNLQQEGYTLIGAPALLKYGKISPPLAAAQDKSEIARYYKEVLKLDYQTTGDWRMRKVKNQKGPTPNLEIVETISSPAQGALVIKQSWKNRDSDQPKASFTEMLHDGWLVDNLKSAGGPKDPKGLKVIMRDNIQSITTRDSRGVELNTVSAIDEVFAKLNYPRDQILKLDAKSTDPNVKAAYELMSSQTHVARPLQWLTDRHESLGNAKIESLLLDTVQHPTGEVRVAINIGH